MTTKNDFDNFARKKMGINSLYLHDFKKHQNKAMGFNASGPIAMTPYIIEERQMNAVQLDVFSRLMMDRIIFFGLPVDDMVANIVNAQMLWLESVDDKKDITIYFNSPGGSVFAGLGIYDVMSYVKPDIVTINTGLSASMAAVLLASGQKGKRYSLKHARTMIHQPMGGVQGQASDIEITAREIKKLKNELYEILSKASGQPKKKIEKDADRDYWMTAEEAKKYGLVDIIL